MKKRYNLILVLALPALFLIFTSEVLYHTGSPGGKTGSPGDNGNNCTDCHSGTPVTEEFWIYSPELLLQDYEPEETYSMIVIGVDSDANKIGFEATAEDESGNKVGTFVADVTGRTQALNGGTSITHTALGSTPIADTGSVFFFSWIAPAEYVGEVTFYTAVNTANGNGNNSGDQIHLSQFTPNSTGVGIAVKDDKGFNIYPNPAKDFVNLELKTNEAPEIKIFNLNGHLESQFKQTAEKMQIDISSFDPGIYFITAGETTERLIVQ